ncbi:MAG TPA: alpha/beta hydrolase [Pyrinomonadaceae bacterium]
MLRLNRPALITRERLIGLGVVVMAALIGLVVGIRSLERAMTFHPVRLKPDTVSRPAGAEDVWITTKDNVRLHAWYFKSLNEPSSATIIYFHGNGGNITNVAWVAEHLSARGFNTLLLDYRGYGQSEGRPDGETSLYADGDAALSYILERRHVSPMKVVLYGQSLGTVVATDLAARRGCGGLILESGLSSASSVAAHALWLPRWLHFLGKNRFESARKLTNVRVPVLITHGDPDPVIPTDEARVLFAAAREPKKLLIYPGAGHNVFGSLGDRYLDEIATFVNESLSISRQ